VDREDAKEYLRAWFKLVKITPKYWALYKLWYLSRLIEKFYFNLINKSVNKPTLLKFFRLRWSAWISRAGYWFEQYDAMTDDMEEPLNTMEYIAKFYHFDM